MPYLYKVVHNTVRFSHTWVRPDGYDTGISVYNCIARRKVPLIVRNKNLVTWYTCGPTVYDSSHIGHASCYVKLDILQRILRNFFGLKLLTVMNITDVDDKIIKKCKEVKVSEAELSQQYEKEFLEDLKLLKVVKPSIILRITEYMPQIKNFIKELIDKKFAYLDQNGSVIFDIKSSNAFYGKLQNIRQKNESDSESPVVNFTLWKKAKKNEPFWDADFGPGRPGWHTECSALASGVFGSAVDIHAGGIDLRFPHHENEEAQCCALFSKSQWVNYWFHTGHLVQNNTKMSKSLKNTMSIKEMLQICDSDVFRVMCLMSHYRSNMEFSNEFIITAESLLKSYKNFISTCNAYISGKFKPKIDQQILNENLSNAVNCLHDALIDDFDTDLCIKIVNTLITTVNKMFNSASVSNDVDMELTDLSAVVSVLNFVQDTLHLFGVELEQGTVCTENQESSTELMDILTDYRQNVRTLAIECKDTTLLHLCDNVRNNLNKIGFVVKDHGKVSSWSKS